MTWIATISYENAEGILKELYNRIKGPDNNVDNIMLAHSLRPHSLQGHMALYKYVLHHPRNQLPKTYLETIGVYVSIINQCDYCIDHHYAGLLRLLKNNERGSAIRASLGCSDPGAVFTGRELAGLKYVEKLTKHPSSVSETDINILKSSGFDDGEILEINQVTAYFSYANRTVLGLGISTENDIIGLSPGDTSDPENWSHS